MEDSDTQLLKDAIAAQVKIEQSGISMMSVETEDSEVIAAIQRVFGVYDSKEITFEMFKSAVEMLNRAGTISGYENA